MYQVDAFAARPFEGNPAAVCPLDAWLPDDLMQAIAAENNLSETAFVVREGDGYRIRWFTPTIEVDLCGHATLASAWVLFNRLGTTGNVVRFESRSGVLGVERDGDRLVLDFPSQVPAPCDVPVALLDSLQRAPVACLRHDDYVLVFDDETFVREVTPDLHRLAEVDCRGVIITSPVTGSAYTVLAPVWAERLGKTQFSARQVSARGGDVYCELRGDRVSIAGTAVCVLEGTLKL